MEATLTYSGIKGQPDKTIVLGKLNLVEGPNDSGKTAMMEAVRLAMTGTCSVASANHLIGRLISDRAFVELRWRDLTTRWVASKVNGSVKIIHNVTRGADELACKSLMNGIPVGNTDFWELPAEEKLQILEQIVGKFDSSDKKDTAALRKQIKDLEAACVIVSYDGRPEKELKEEIEGLESWLVEQTKLVKFKAWREATMSQGSTTIDELQKDIDNNTLAIAGLNGEVDKIAVAIKEITGLVETCRDYAGITSSQSLAEYFDKTCTVISEDIRKLCDALETTGAPEYTADLADMQDRLEEMKASIAINPAVIAKSRVALTARSNAILESIGLSQANTIDGALDAARFQHDNKLKEIKKLNDKIEAAQSEIAKVQSAIDADCSGLEKLASDESLAAKANELSDLKEEHVKAIQFLTQTAAIKANMEKVAKLNQQIAEIDEHNATVAAKRKEYLDSIKQKVEAPANELLSKLGVKPLSIDIVIGKRSAMTIKSGDVDITAMSGSQQVLYGTALLFAIHKLANLRNSVMFISASELSDARLQLLVDALASSEIPGMVFVEHWFTGTTVPATAAVHIFGGSNA